MTEEVHRVPANTEAQSQEAERETEKAHNPQIDPQPSTESSIMPESHIPPGASYTAGPGGASVFKSNSESHTLSQEDTPRQPHLSPAHENHDMTNVDNVGGIEVDMDRDNNTAYIHSSSDAEVEVCILPTLMVDLLILGNK